MRKLKLSIASMLMVLSPLMLSAANHIVFIHGFQWQSVLRKFGSRHTDVASTWDNMTNLMSNASLGTPFLSREKMLVVDFKTGEHNPVSTDMPIELLAHIVMNQIKAGFPDGTTLENVGKIDFVVHSMGGLVLRSMVAQGLISDSQIGRVVTLGTPHFGVTWSGSVQEDEMHYGSEFIWNLANASKKISRDKVLCVVGTADRTVYEYSAALNEQECKDVRYVNKDHTDAVSADSNAICECSKGRNDVVYRRPGLADRSRYLLDVVPVYPRNQHRVHLHRDSALRYLTDAVQLILYQYLSTLQRIVLLAMIYDELVQLRFNLRINGIHSYRQRVYFRFYHLVCLLIEQKSVGTHTFQQLRKLLVNQAECLQSRVSCQCVSRTCDACHLDIRAYLQRLLQNTNAFLRRDHLVRNTRTMLRIIQHTTTETATEVTSRTDR